MRLSTNPPRPKKCGNATCRNPFVPSRSFQSWCSPDCALVIARQKQDRERKSIDKVERKAIRAAKERVRSRAGHMKEAQAAFNSFIRERDRDLPCISCGRHHQGQWHAGHYRTVGANPELRFEPLNVHKQCAPCNNHKSGDIVNYRINLVAKIGAEKVEWLEGPHEAKRYDLDEVKAIKAKFRSLVREMKKGVA